jgi:hypothetical protein
MEQTQEITGKALTIIDQGKAVVIKTTDDYRAAGDLWTTIKGILKQVDESFDPIISKAHQAHKEAVAQKAKIYDPLKAVYVSVKGLMSKWDQEQEAIRQAEQRRLEEISRKEAEERALMDAIHAEEEAKRRGATKEESAQEAEAVMAEPVYVPPVILPKETPKVQGMSFRTIWKYRIVNEAIIPRQYLIPDEKKIGAVIRANQGEISIPGITPYEERV